MKKAYRKILRADTNEIIVAFTDFDTFYKIWENNGHSIFKYEIDVTKERYDALRSRMIQMKETRNSKIHYRSITTDKYLDLFEAFFKVFPKFDKEGIDKFISEFKPIYNEYLEKRRCHSMSMPDLPRQDNKDYIVYGYGSNRNSIRYPKKCRKTAWKRFYKLFPSLKPKE